MRIARSTNNYKLLSSFIDYVCKLLQIISCDRFEARDYI